MSKIIAARLGRQVILDGETEYLHKADGDIAPTGGLDIGASSAMTFAILAEVAYAENFTRRALFAKRDTGDPTTLAAGYMLYRDDDNEVKFLLDDGVTTLIVPTGLELIDDGYAHVIGLHVDRPNDELVVWASPTKDHRSVLKLGTFDISTVAGSADNAESFCLGGQYDVGTATPAVLWKGGVTWAAVYSALVPERFMRVLGRFDFPPPQVRGRHLVSLWHFSQRNSDDWNRTNKNDLIETGIDTSNYQQGPERFLDISTISTTPSMGEQAGTASVDFVRFKPLPQQEGRFFEAGVAQAPPLRIRRTTRGATDFVNTTFQGGHATVYGAYASVESREGGGGTDTLRLYDVRVNDNPGDETRVDKWEPLGKITGDSLLRNSCRIWAADNNGVQNYLFGFSSATLGGTEGFRVIDVQTPATPARVGTLARAGRNTNMVLYDARPGVEYCYTFDVNGGVVESIDVSTRNAPALGQTFIDTRLQPVIGSMVQIGNRLYLTSQAGLVVLDITNPLAISFTAEVNANPTDLPNPDGMTAVVISASGNLFSAGQDTVTASNGTTHVWSLKDPDLPELVKREARSDFSGIQRLMRRGTVIFSDKDPGGITELLAWGEPDPLGIGFIARYVLRDYDPTFAGVTTFVDLDRSTMLFARLVPGGTGHVGFFRCDDGYGQVSWEADYPVPTVAVTNPVPAYELKYLVHNLKQWDFEGQTVGAAPAGFTVTKDDAASSAVISDVRALTGQPPGSPVKPQSCALTIGGAGTQVGIRAAVASSAFIDPLDFAAGRNVNLTFWYEVEGAGAFDATTDIRIRVQETGGSLSTDVSHFGEYSEAERWYRVELNYQIVYADTTGLNISFDLLNATGVTVYLDTCRAGPGKIYPLVSGRVMSAAASGATAELKSLVYGVELLDNTFDLNRLNAAEERREPEPIKDFLDYLLATYTRAIDDFDTNNVLELVDPGNPWLIEPDEKVAPLISRAVTSGQGQWSLRDRSIFAMPPGYEAAPAPLNDVVFGMNPDFSETEDGGELVTDLDVRGDRGLSNPPTDSYNDADLKSQYGDNAYAMDYNADIATPTQAANVRDLKRGLLGHTQVEGSVSFTNEPRFRPGQIIPLQIDVRGYDQIVVVSAVSHTVNEGGQLTTSVQFKLLQQELIDLLFPDSDPADQAKTKAFVDDAVSASAWLP